MSLYREAGSRRGRSAGVVAAVLVVGALVGFAVAWAVKPEPTLADRIEDVQAEVRPALDALELVPIHYESTNPVTRRAAREQLESAHADYLNVADDLDSLEPHAKERLTADFEALGRLLVDGVPAPRVRASVVTLEFELRRTARLD